MTDFDDYDDETPEEREQAIAGAQLIAAAMRAGKCRTFGDLIEAMGQRGTRDFREFIRMCDAEGARR